MTKRLHYKCPLDAAYMVKNFEVLVVIELPTRDAIINDWEEILEAHEEDCYRQNYYVHPESIGILDPQVGDLLRHKDGGYGVVFSGAGILTVIWSNKVEPDALVLIPNKFKIIERDNKYFISPEFEDEE